MSAEKTPAEKSRPWHWQWFVFLPLGLLAVYFLFSGPLVWMADRGALSNNNERRLQQFYAPLDWAYDNTSCHKPIGLYLHLWSNRFDQHGDLALGGVD